ncbi:hypothetical protein FNV43_RR05593 [Rhamnella rubrinervis]|uniref:Histidine-containing phosphotransfer protein n=1 Tax=Rhamnella rubrinervis TaxID=2594499 RepID=A0A8K0HP33_9ROSA|nr:hypothetical protein FNV43_RR05593 [Rhamnella rubrinervis]
MQGILDERYDKLRTQSEEDPSYATRIIDMFFNVADASIAKITKLLGETEVNYTEVGFSVTELRASCSSVGGGRLEYLSRNLGKASHEKDPGRCIEELESVTKEYNILKESLNHISQLEKKKD